MKISKILGKFQNNEIYFFVDTYGTFLPRTGEICLPLYDGVLQIENDVNLTYRSLSIEGKTAVFLRKIELRELGYRLKRIEKTT